MGEGPVRRFSCWKQRRSGLRSATLEGPWSLGAPWCLQEQTGGPRAGRPSPPQRVEIPPLAKAEESAVYCPPPAPRLHVHQPRLLRTKACTVCTRLAWPLTSSPGQSELPEEGRTRFLLLVLTPL